MDLAMAKSALKQIAELDLAEKVTFHVMGEPMMHPRLLEIIEHAHSCGVPIGLTTNGALLKPETIRALAELDLRQIDISLQTPDEGSFQATRGKRVNFELYCERVLDLIAACAARPHPPIFKVRIMVTRFAGKMREELKIPDFMGSGAALHETVRHWMQLIYRRLELDKPNSEILEQKIRKLKIWRWNVIEISPKIFLETYLLTDWGNTFITERMIEANFGYCFGMRDHFAILYNGDVTLCCVDFDGRTAFGNLKKAPLVEILNSPSLHRIMKGFHRGKILHQYCRRCLGSRTRLGSLFKPVMTILGFKVMRPFVYKKYKMF
jgi:MoaA/NifB/PqqE/SkfB family radical SAM enzyme